MSCSFLCQVFYLSFSKAMTLNCSSLVYYSWKGLFLQNILKCVEGQTSSLKINTDLLHKITMPAFQEGNLSMY